MRKIREDKKDKYERQARVKGRAQYAYLTYGYGVIKKKPDPFKGVWLLSDQQAACAAS